jgi:hypothetical protein
MTSIKEAFLRPPLLLSLTITRRNRHSFSRTSMLTVRRDRPFGTSGIDDRELAGLDGALSLVDLSQDALSSSAKIHSFFSRCEAAGAARDQADPSPALQRRETLADDAERQVHFPRGCGKAPRCDDTDESPQFVDVIEHEAS